MAINLLLAGHIALPFALQDHCVHYLQRLALTPITLWLTINLVLIAAYLLICWRFWVTLMHIMQALHGAAQQLQPAQGRMMAVNRTHLLREMAQLSQLAEAQAHQRAELKRELEATREVLTRYHAEHQLLLRATGHEVTQQYHAVLGYAHYLDEHIARRAHDPQLRYDFDDVCESSFNLRMITGALTLLKAEEPARFEPTSLAQLMQRTMLALSASLDRRAMKLTTAEVDLSVTAWSDPGLLSHVLWMMLLGMVRYAADESTLRMRCLYDHGQKRALLSIVVSELAPGKLTQEERQAHLLRQERLDQPHMFAETLMRHGNVQLAEMLLVRLGASISVLPLSPYACELCLSLPVGPKN